jgi:uncharacterized protein (TIGR02302 family)
VIVLFSALALFGFFEIAPIWLHWSMLAVLGALGALATGVGLKNFKRPSRAQAIQRLEADSNLLHRPVTHLEDRQASNLVDPLAERLWSLHRTKLLRSIGALRLLPAPSDLARRDPYALRILVVLLLFAGLGLSWGQASERLLGALRPAPREAAVKIVAVEAWITPPDYTRLPPIVLTPVETGTSPPQAAEPAEALSVPVGSRLLVQIQGASTPAALTANDKRLAFDNIDKETQRADVALRSGAAIEVTAGNFHARWPINLVPDNAPSAKLEEPRATERGVLRLSYSAQDDFGVNETELTVTRNGESIDLPLPIHAIDPRQVKGSSFQDLTAHPWAGLDVELRVVARDAMGQIGASAPRAIALPERKFFHPVARAIIEMRKRLAQNSADAPKVARGLRQLQGQPEAFDDNVATFLALDFASRRLEAKMIGKDALSAIEQLLWDTALALEDGGVSLAMRELRRLQRALEEALANGASDEEIQRLMNDLQQAMNDYLQQLQQQLAKALEKGMQLGAMDENSLALSQQDLNDMLNQARRMAESGARESAQQMLDQLQNMLENLQMGVPMMAGRDSQGQRMLGDLGRIMRQQQQLLEDTFRMQRDRQSGDSEGEMSQGTQGPPGSAGEGAQRQEALREMLGDLMRRFSNMTGEIPQGMGAAEQAMRGASDALRGNELESAAKDQNEALQSLQQSMQQMSEMMRQQIGSRRGQGEREPMDPFGRSLSDQEGPGGDAVARDNIERVPLEQEIDRSRQLFEELRTRRNEPSRPKMERDYIDRLLQQF